LDWQQDSINPIMECSSLNYNRSFIKRIAILAQSSISSWIISTSKSQDCHVSFS